jgi:hypothetical protein
MDQSATADEVEGRTERAENSCNIRCDSEEEDIVNKRFERFQQQP